jgi:PAS domain S-box-containing protein
MQLLQLNAHRVMGLVLCLLGTVVLAGWVIGSSALVRMMPGSVAMSINTAVMFLVAGICLLSWPRDDQASILQKIGACVLVVLSALILLEHIFDTDFGIDLAHVHAALGDGHSRPGRTAPNACLGFLFAGLAFLSHSRQTAGRYARHFTTVLALVVIAIGFTALLGYVLSLETMYRFTAFNRIATPTALGLSVLGIGLWQLRFAHAVVDDSLEAHEKRITRKTVGVLTMVALSVGILGFSLIRDSFERSTVENVRVMAATNATSITNILDSGMQFASALAYRPVVLASFSQLKGAPGDDDVRQGLRVIGEGLINAGLAGVRFVGADGVPLSESGAIVRGRALVAHQLDTPGQRAFLLWQEGYVLHTQNEIASGGRLVGTVVTEQRLPALDKLLSDIRVNGASRDVLICSREQDRTVCAPSGLYADVMNFPMFNPDGKLNFPVNRALAGQSGVMTAKDLRGIPVVAAYTPLSDFGLGMVVKVDAETIYAPLRARFNFWAALLIAVVTLGTFALKFQVQPLVSRIASEQRRMKIILENSHDAFIAVDTDGCITDWNNKAERIFGWTAAEAIGKDLGDLITPPDQRAAHKNGLKRFAVTGVGKIINNRVEVTALHRSGKAIPVELAIAGFLTGKGHAATAFIKDLTERKEAERLEAERVHVLEETRTALQHSQKLEAVGKLTGGVAHDFNNVLQIIGSNLQLLQTHAGFNHEAHRRLSSALSAVDRGAKLSSHLLAFARRQPLQPLVVNLRRAVSNIDDLLRQALGESVEIETIFSGGLWNTYVDPHQLENVILNLAINARDAMQGDGKLTIEIGNAMLDDEYALAHPDVPSGQYVMLAISDTGAGMTPEVLERAFEPFYSTKPEGQGTGLGLSMAYGFVKQSGGHIKIYSEVGHGTTVKVYLPRAFDAEAEPPADSGDLLVGGSETILVVEDDLEVQTSVVDMLAGFGYRVLKADDGQSALQILNSGTPIDLLFTDVVMPGPVRSADVARQARQIFPNIEVLFTSGYTQNAIVHGGRLDPGVHLLSKPYRREQLARKVRHLLVNRPQPSMPTTSLPLAGPEPHGSPAPPAEQRILVVEDNDDLRMLACEMLSILGYKAHGIDNAEQALDLLRSNEFNVLFTDITLPGMNGVALAEKASMEIKGLKVIFASGYADTIGGVAGAESVVLTKPYHMAQLQEALDQLSALG